VDKPKVAAVSLAGIYLAACAWSLWDRLDAILLLAVASPLAAGFMLPRETSKFSRLFMGALIDAFLAALALVPVVGDFIDLGASAVALVLLIMRFRQFVSSLPGGLACLVLYAFLWFEARLSPHGLSVSAVHHAFWFYPVIVIASVLAGGAILAVLTMSLGLMYHGDRAKAIFCTIGFPWLLIAFLITIFLPSRHARHAHQGAEIARRPG
jgi:hypothetical protein